MAESLTNFVLKLAEDPNVLNRFQTEPVDMMERAGLSKAEQAVLLSNDPKLIRNAIAADTNGPEELAGTTIVITAIIIVRPEVEE